MAFGFIPGLWALLALVPFILIYLFRPRPVDKIIPSLMFFMREDKQKKKFSFFRRLLTNLLFLIQLLAILALAFAMAEPYITLNKNAAKGDTVLVIDSSASMQTIKDGKTRFDQAVSIAKQKMHGRVSIILASLTPNIALENGLQVDALTSINALKPSETSTNIKGAMDMADSILEKKKGHVVVLSDFITTAETDDPIISKRLLNARGNSVEFVNLASKAKNIGFVELYVRKDYTEATIKNFNEEKATITISLVKKNGETVKSEEVTIYPKSKHNVVFQTLPGQSTLQINPKDDTNADNIVYISSPMKENIPIMLISNNVPKSIKDALSASSYIKLDIAEPPIIPDIKHDVVIMSNIKKEELLPGAFNDIKRYVEKGGSLIITVQDGIGSIDMLDLLPVSFGENGNRSNIIAAAQNEVTRDIEFGTTNRYIKATPKEKATTLLNAEDGSTLMAYMEYGNGKIIYYGLFDDENEFRFSPDYPIFWNNIINFLLNTEDIDDYNFKIGESSLNDKAGFVEQDGKIVAYNLLDEKESDVSKDPSLFDKEYSDFVEKDVVEKIDNDLTMPILIIGFILILFEFWSIKFRGDL